MIKTFTIRAVTHKEISPGKGSIVWQLTDEAGNPRKVTAITTLDKNGYIDHMQAIYKRERPLVEALQQREEGEIFTKDFSKFNRENGYVAREMYNNMNVAQSTAMVSKRVNRVFMGGSLLVLLWLAYYAFTGFASLVNG